MSTREKSPPRAPLSADALRKVVGGRGDDKNDRPDTAVLIDQSIAAHEAGAEAATLQDADIPAPMSAQELSVEDTGDEDIGGEIADGSAQPAPEMADFSDAAVMGRMAVLEALPVDDSAEMLEADADSDEDTIADEDVQPLVAELVAAPVTPAPPAATDVADDGESVEEAAAETVASKTGAATADKAAPEPTETEHDSSSDRAETMQDDAVPKFMLPKKAATPPVAEAKAVPADPAADTLLAEAATKGTDSGAQQSVPASETLVTLASPKNYYERERERNQLGAATAKLVNLHAYSPSTWAIAEAHQAQDVHDAAVAKSTAANKDWADKVKSWRPYPEVFNAAKVKDAAEAEVATAAKLLAGKKLPADYKPHARTNLVSPWKLDADAKAAYLKAKASGDAGKTAEAKKLYDAVKLPEGKAAKVELMKAKHKAAENKVLVIQMKMASVDKSAAALAAKKATAQPKLVKGLVEYKALLERNPHMRDLTYYARDYTKTRTAEVVATYHEFKDSRMGLQMLAAYKAELVKDLNAANKDLVRTAAFVDVAQQSDGEPAKDLAAADEKIKAADAQWAKAGEAMMAAVKEDQAAADANKAARAESVKAKIAYEGKADAFRKLDPVTDQRIKGLEARQDLLMNGQHGSLVSIKNSEFNMVGAQKRIDAEKKVIAEKEVELLAAGKFVVEHQNWGTTIYNIGKHNTTTDFAVGKFDDFANAVKNAGKVAGELALHQKQMAQAVQELAKEKTAHAGMVTQYNELARLISWAKMGGEQANKLGREAFVAHGKKTDEFGPVFKALIEKADATKKTAAATKQKLDNAAMQLAKVEGRRGPLFEGRLGGLRVAVNEAQAEHFTATQLAEQAQADVDLFRGHKENEMPTGNGPTQVAFKQKQALIESLVQTDKWAKEDVARGEKAEVKKARLEAIASWETFQGTIGKVKAATAREEATSKRAYNAALEVKAASFAQKLAVSAKQSLEIRAFNFLDAQKAELGAKVGAAAGDIKKTMQAQLELNARAQAKLGKTVAAQYDDDAPQDVGTAAGSAAAVDPEVAKAEAAKTKADNKAALTSLQSTAKMNSPGKLEPTKGFKKESGEAWKKITPKKVDPSVSKLGLNQKAKEAAIESLAEKFGSKAGELSKSLAGDMMQEIVRLHAQQDGQVHKVAYEKTLAGEVTRQVSTDGLRTIDTVAQVTVKTQADAYLSNLGVYATSEFGLKLEAGAAGAGKAQITSGLTVGGNGKVYAVGGVEVAATGVVNTLGLSAEIVAKAHARGEVEGLAGFGIGEHVELMQGGKAGIELLASASAGGKLGMDGGTVKLSASAEAAARAAYVQNAKLGDLNVGANVEAWAKARAEAVANFSAGLVKGNLDLTGKIGASAGAGAGVQMTKKVKLFGMELEVTGGVSAGKLGANVAVEVGYKNGVLRWSVDVGAALGIGINLKLAGSIDFAEVIKAASHFLASIVQHVSPEFANYIKLSALKFTARTGGQVFK